jgi:hypothetical protein
MYGDIRELKNLYSAPTSTLNKMLDSIMTQLQQQTLNASM